MYGAHLRIAYTQGKEEQKIKAKLIKYMLWDSRMIMVTGIKVSARYSS